jgi:dihydroorotase
LPLRKRPPSKTKNRQRESTLLIEGCRVWTRGRLVPASLLINDGRIVRISRHIPKHADKILRADGLVAFPGMIDAHVHLRDLDLSYKEDFTSGTAAAAAGGFTTVLDMPNTEPPTDSAKRLNEKIEKAQGMILTNVGFHVAAVPNPVQISQMSRMGAYSLKLYMPKPISPLDVQDEKTVLSLLHSSRKSHLRVTVHAEDQSLIRGSDLGKTISFVELAKTRPEEAEGRAVNRVLSLATKTGCTVHLSHLTLPSSILEARKYSQATTEVTPHHILLSEKTIKRKGWKAWMVPPLRPERMRKNLLALMSKGLVTMVASDHAPHTIEEKSQTVAESPPGVPGLETTLPLMLTLVTQGVLSMSLLVRLLSGNPARVFNLPRKGRLEKGYDADIILVDLKHKARVRPERFHSKAKYSPFENMHIRGRVQTTIVGGTVVFQDDEIVGKPGSGMIMKMGASGSSF